MEELAHTGPQVGSTRTRCREPGYTLAQQGFTKWNVTHDVAERQCRDCVGGSVARGMGVRGSGARCLMYCALTFFGSLSKIAAVLFENRSLIPPFLKD